MDKATMSVYELSVKMGISLPKAYELTKKAGFPSVRVGTRLLIPVIEFYKWLNEQSKNLHSKGGDENENSN